MKPLQMAPPGRHRDRYSGLLNYRILAREHLLSNHERALRQELAALKHELRRVNDGIERNRTHQLEARARLLRDSIALCEGELQQITDALQSLTIRP